MSSSKHKRGEEQCGEATRCKKQKIRTSGAGLIEREGIFVGTEITNSKLPIAIAFDNPCDALSEDGKEDASYGGPFEGTPEQRIASFLEHLKHYEEANLLDTLRTINHISLYCFKRTAKERLSDFVMNSKTSKESALKELAELMVRWGCW